MSHVGTAFRRIITPQHTFVTQEDAHSLVKAAQRDNEEAGFCCSGPGTKGSDRLKDLFLKPENKNKFMDINSRVQLSRFLEIDHQGLSKEQPK